ncbi:hypothetical protein FYJ84_03725 [Veillonellaceae bacterium WCA-693-APC-5D-A]|uniref:Glycosyltransferase RgtA/B/C/D-like domain-containing protein n=1 Tax=Anaerovibrio slackiae TaxID=2652309 RepID=A0A6I2UFZ4_9FIRM|nr:hypothetical protein [Anaerovibrio slackiae]MSU08101.1 hypothetical protein [Anaerovibrio slackiae]
MCLCFCKRLFTCLLLSICVGAVSIVAVYKISSETVFFNIKPAEVIYEKSGDYPQWLPGNLTTQLDNFTDTLMLQNCIYSENNAFEASFLNPRRIYTKDGQVKNLLLQLQDATGYVYTDYPIYWHGYIVVLKPLLYFIDVSDLCLFNAALQLVLAIYFLHCLNRKIGVFFALSYLLVYLLLNPISLAMSFQFSIMYYIMTISSIFMIKNFKRLLERELYITFFMVVGIITAYFDFLTYPLVSLSIPLVIFLVMLANIPNNLFFSSYSKVLLYTSYISLSWVCGYFCMFLGKWVLAWIITGNNIVNNGFARVLYRTSSGGDITAVSAISNNLNVFMTSPLFDVLVICLLFLLCRVFVSMRRYHINKNILHLSFGVLIISVYPFIWYMILSNHSFIHAFFTYRELSIFIFAFCCFVALIEKNKCK